MCIRDRFLALAYIAPMVVVGLAWRYQSETATEIAFQSEPAINEHYNLLHDKLAKVALGLTVAYGILQMFIVAFIRRDNEKIAAFFTDHRSDFYDIDEYGRVGYPTADESEELLDQPTVVVADPPVDDDSIVLSPGAEQFGAPMTPARFHSRKAAMMCDA